MIQKHYSAFISYKHAEKDNRVAEEVQRRIGSGEIDFYDLAREMQQGSTKKRVPPVVPRTSGNTAHANGVMDLSDAQFDRLDRALEEGTVYDMRR